jgi:ADP-heptose:LPS heptosyltransferase
MHYPLIHQCNQRNIHFIDAYIHYLNDKLNINLKNTHNKPFIYLTNKEKSTNKYDKYWLICSGYKNDYTVKNWGYHNYQKVVNAFYNKIQFIQVGESEHNHKPLEKVINLIGKTNHRQLFKLAWHAQGGLGGVSYLHHIFASFQKPFVCIASGMEPTTWEKYNTEIYLTKQGCLPCCNHGGCWKSHTTKLNKKTNNLCLLPVIGEDTIPKCMDMIHPEEVINAINSYYSGGLLKY